MNAIFACGCSNEERKTNKLRRGLVSSTGGLIVDGMASERYRKHTMGTVGRILQTDGGRLGRLSSHSLGVPDFLAIEVYLIRHQ